MNARPRASSGPRRITPTPRLSMNGGKPCLQTRITSVETAQTSKAVEDTTRADVNVVKGDILVAKAAINDAKAQQLQEAATLDFHTLLAPYDAVVTARQRELGSALAAGEAVFTLIDPQSIWVLAHISTRASRGNPGRRPGGNRVALAPGPPFRGRVARIETESDRVNEERRVQVAFDRLPVDFHIGEQAEVFVTTVHLERAVLSRRRRSAAAPQSAEPCGRSKTDVCSDARSRSVTACSTVGRDRQRYPGRREQLRSITERPPDRTSRQRSPRVRGHEPGLSRRQA